MIMNFEKIILKLSRLAVKILLTVSLAIIKLSAIFFVYLFKQTIKGLSCIQKNVHCQFLGHKRQVYNYLQNRKPDCGHCGRLIK
jgi:hypothetical protein